MSYFEAAVLGIIQGLTEFLPVSSSGHLVLVQELWGVNPEGVTFEILMHLGSLLAVLVYFRKRLWLLLNSLFAVEQRENRNEMLYLLIGTVPAGLAGVVFEDFFDRVFSSPMLTSVMLVVTGLILLSTRFVKHGSRPVTLLSAIVMGTAQALAIMPGISRAGATISAGMLLKVEPSKATEFSFLLAIPAIAGATVFKFDEILSGSSGLLVPYIIGAALAFVFSLIAIQLMLTIIKKGRFELFAYYCFAAGGLGLYLFW